MSEIYFIRHGQASFGSNNYDKLSEKGVLQARILGEHLAALKVKFDAIYLGDMVRQKETAQEVMNVYIERGLYIPEPMVDICWNEIDSTSVWDSQIKMMIKEEAALLDEFKMDLNNKKAFQKVFSRVMDRWVSGKFDVPGVVTWNEFKHKVGNGLNHLLETQRDSKRVAVFSSGGPISIAVQMALDLSDKKTLALLWQIMNVSVTRLKYDDVKTTLSVFNNTTHLELKGDKTLITYR